MSNQSLKNALKIKNDEFYTLYDDIAKEISQYNKSEFEGKIIYCNCDDFRFSNFVKYFKDNFSNLGLKELIATNFDIGEGAFKYSFNGMIEAVTPLEGNGDFSSDECVAILEKSDLIITNPPFSLFRKFIDLIISKEKKFLVIGNLNAISYKNVFEYIKEDKIRLGYKTKNLVFKINNDFKSIGARFFTNLSVIDKTIKKPKQDYFKSIYETYHNCHAIDIPKSSLIPYNYDGLMGVPISYLDYFDYDTFEIVGLTKKGFFDITFSYENPRMIKSNSSQRDNTINTKLTLLKNQKPFKTYYTADNVEGFIIVPYARLLIRKKQN